MQNGDVWFLAEHGYRFLRHLYIEGHGEVGINDTEVDLLPDPDNTVVALAVHQASQAMVAVKRQRSCAVCLDYEYRVSSELYQRSQDGPEHLRLTPKVYDLLVDEETGYQYLITEHIDGKPLSWIVERLQDLREQPQDTPDDIASFLAHLGLWYLAMLERIHEFSQRYRFTHYDLHMGNIMVRFAPDINPDEDLSIPVDFKLIDFGLSHLDGVSGWARSGFGSLVIGAIPTVYDPWFDLVRLIVMYYWSVVEKPMPSAMHNMLTENGFLSVHPSTQLEELQGVSEPIKEQLYPGAEIIPAAAWLDRLPGEIWNDGFWVGIGSQVHCDEASVREHLLQVLQPMAAETTDDIRRALSDVLTCVKRDRLRLRPITDPRKLLQLFRWDVLSS